MQDFHVMEYSESVLHRTKKKNRICVLLEACGVHVFIKEKKEKWKLLNRQKLPIMQFKKNNFKKLYCWI